MAAGIEPLASERARTLLGRFTTNRFAGVATGGDHTILDSSSVTIILVIVLVNGGLLTFAQSLGVIMASNIGTTVSSQITLPAGLAVMLGAEIGTCADTLVASIGRSRAALRAGVCHLPFNIITAVGLIFIEQLGALALALPGGDTVPRQILNAHVAFNVIGVGLFVWFTPPIASLLERLLPEQKGRTVG